MDHDHSILIQKLLYPEYTGPTLFKTKKKPIKHNLQGFQFEVHRRSEYQERAGERDRGRYQQNDGGFSNTIDLQNYFDETLWLLKAKEAKEAEHVIDEELKFIEMLLQAKFTDKKNTKLEGAYTVEKDFQTTQAFRTFVEKMSREVLKISEMMQTQEKMRTAAAANKKRELGTFLVY